jgi:Phosphoglucomutase
VQDLANVIDLEAIRSAGVRIGVDPLGGASAAYWAPLAERYGLGITIVNSAIDPTFSFMTVDHDGKIRMDCSSPYAMASLVSLKDRFDVAFGNDPDADRHGIVTPSVGLMNPNHYLAVAIRLPPGSPAAVVNSRRRRQNPGQQLSHRPRRRKPGSQTVGGTGGLQVVYARPVRRLLLLRRRGKRRREFPAADGTVWSTDKDGLILSLLAAEITARTGKDPGAHYQELTAEFGTPYYTRIDAPATPEQKNLLKKLSPEAVTAQNSRRTDHGETHPSSRQRRPDWRAEGRLNQRLVCRTSFRHREHL